MLTEAFSTPLRAIRQRDPVGEDHRRAALCTHGPMQESVYPDGAAGPMGQSIYNRNRTSWRLAWGLTVLGALCLGPSLAAAQADLNEDLVHCEAPQGPESLDNGSSRCTATAADTGHA